MLVTGCNRVLAVLAAALLLLAACGQRSAPPLTKAAAAAAPHMSFLASPRFDDLDPHDWQGITPTRYPVHGVDVSRYQGRIDWRAARRGGVAFAYIKATEGGDHADPMFREHWRGTSAAGVRRGAYHYFYFCRPAAEQARWFIRHVPRDDSALPHVLDMEWNHRSRTCNKRPDGAKVRAEARRFLDILERHYGRRPIVYTTPDFYRETGIGRLAGTQFWLRSVAGHPRETYPGARWTFWQYTGTGVVPGIDGPVDINAFAGPPEIWASWPG